MQNSTDKGEGIIKDAIKKRNHTHSSHSHSHSISDVSSRFYHVADQTLTGRGRYNDTVPLYCSEILLVAL